MLNKEYRYIGLDFETTGLDPFKDEPIQIGIVELDADGKIIDQFQSLIKPSKKTDELKHIVGFITGFSISDLEHAPLVDQVEPQISKFFDKHTVVIGHNAQFDLDFLKRYFPSMTYAFAVDTFQFSQTFVHYAPSYALEVLIQHLQEKDSAPANGTNRASLSPWLESYGLAMSSSKDSFHDALYDTKHSLALYMYFISTLSQLCQKYPNLVQFVKQDASIFSKIFVPPILDVSSPIKFLALEKIFPSKTSVKSKKTDLQLAGLEHAKKYYVGNIYIKDLLHSLASQKHLILSFSNLQKLEIAKEILHQFGIKNLGFIKEDQTINEKKFQQFLNKKVFSHEEVLFVIKYVSHLDRGYGTLDLNNKFDYQIYSFIKDSREQVKYPLVLATHSSLFSILDNELHAYKDYAVCFFDVEQRYKSYNFFLSRPCDLYYTLNLLETLLYKQGLKYQLGIDNSNKKSSPTISTKLQDFYQYFQILIGELSIETKKLFTDTSKTYIQHDPILGHSDFYKTTLCLNKMSGCLEGIKDDIEESDFVELSRQIAHMFNVFDSVVNINKKIYGQSDFYFVYSENAKFTSWPEFVDLFTSSTTYFFSNTNKQCAKLSENEEKTVVPMLPFDEKFDKLIDYLSTSFFEDSSIKKSVFVVSTQKEQSKKIFEEIYQKRIHERALLLVENITGGVGKNIFKAKQEKGSKILIGGYSFLLYAYANKIPLDEILIFNVNGPSKQQILDDIRWYAFT
ncbi:MAG: hypothetical protein CO170_03800 [candidate division SR1 bacterium CG_4_9_14_3_um_filter_40_9]|nr:MAG: hypothetical protein CO170_03800 [candidate division SR1 bacterium CG_4_9_14_3_um_filter_40_9]